MLYNTNVQVGSDSTQNIQTTIHQIFQITKTKTNQKNQSIQITSTIHKSVQIPTKKNQKKKNRLGAQTPEYNEEEEQLFNFYKLSVPNGQSPSALERR